MHQPITIVRRCVAMSVACAALTMSAAMPSMAQMRMGMKDRIVDNVANTMVSSIQSDSCADFAAMMRKRKSGGSSASGASGASGMMKKDPEARQRFVNRVAGPLVNKMIDCDMLPGH